MANQLILAVVLGLAAFAAGASAACPTNGAAVGFSGPLTTIDHGASTPIFV